MKSTRILLCGISICLVGACKKQNPTPPTSTPVAAGTVLNSEANVVMTPIYTAFSNDAATMYNAAVAFQSNPTPANLNSCRQSWLTTTADYEISSAILFGPAGSLGTDPSSLINTYPIDTSTISSMVSGTAVFTQDYIDSLPPYLTGFHGMEFELYGNSGTKVASQFTAEQLSYITAIALNIKNVAWQIDSEWSPTYENQFINAGNGASIYHDQRAAFSDMVMAIANICETDAIYKLNGILKNKSLILQESPFANNSLVNIQNNLIGMNDIYLGQYGSATGTGLSAFVSQSDITLDLKIKTDISAAIKAVSLITVPLSQAIITQPSNVQLAANMCDSLSDDLKTSLLLYTNLNTN